MSRIIVKNLPKKITANELQDLFASKGCITDLQLKYTKSGVFRQFAFVGYKTEEDALAAKEYFHNAYIHAAKVQVDICANLGDANKPRAWSKHSKENTISNNEKNLNKESTLLENNKEEKKKKSKKSKTKDPLETFPEELRNDSQFKEFLELNKDRKSKPVWCDDTADFKDVKNKVSQSGSESSDDNSSSEEEDNELPESKIAQNKQISDMEYLRSKMKSDVKAKEGEESKEKEQKIPAAKVKKVFDDQFTLKVKNLPYLCKKKQIKTFFHPLKLKSIRIPPKSKGFAYVNCKTEKDMKQALNKSKGFLDGHRIVVVQYERKNIFHPDEDKIKQCQEAAGGYNIKFCWVPGHVGIKKNELADITVKSATLANDQHLAFPFSDFKPVIRVKLLEL